jgi:aspartate-semialdehyde dehydrogenase
MLSAQSTSPRIAIVGATGAVGGLMYQILLERGFPHREIVLFASERSVGRELHGLVVQSLTHKTVQGFDFVFFSAGSQVSREWAKAFVDGGATVIDNSSAWRMDKDVPLVITEVNPQALESIPKGIIANPNCVTMAVLVALSPLNQSFDLRRFVGTTYQAAGGAGQKGIDELANQVIPLHEQREKLVSDGAQAYQVVKEYPVHGKPLAFNVIPLLGHEEDNHYTDEELKLVYESQKILGLPDLEVAPSCIRVPVYVGHSIQIQATFAKAVSVEDVKAVLSTAQGIILDDVPTPMEWAGCDQVVIGRIRQDLNDPKTVHIFVVNDNLRKGAALNAVQIAEEILKRL